MANTNENQDLAPIANESFQPVTDKLPDILDWLPASAKPAWELIDQVPILAGFVVICIFFFTALVIRFVLIRFLLKLTATTATVLDDTIVESLRKPIFTTIMFFGVALGIKSCQLPFGTVALINISVSIIVASWMRSTFGLSNKVLDSLGRVHQKFPLVEPRTVPLLDLSIKLLILLIGSYALLLIWGINPVGWLASAGIVGIAVGFAAKDTLANIFSGFFILIDAPYKVGDYVNLDSGERGCVTHIGLRSTRLLSRDDNEITLPNAVIANSKIVNESGGIRQSIRIGIPVGVAYGSDANQVCALLKKLGDEHKEICSDPAPRARMRAFGASSLDFELLGWIEKPEDRGRIKHELLINIYNELKAQNIEIPYNKTDVYIKSLPENFFKNPSDN